MSTKQSLSDRRRQRLRPERGHQPLEAALRVLLERGQPPAIGRHGEEVHRGAVLETMARLAGPRIWMCSIPVEWNTTH